MPSVKREINEIIEGLKRNGCELTKEERSDIVEQTPGWGKAIVRCVACHRPGVQTFGKGVRSVTWTDEINSVVHADCKKKTDEEIVEGLLENYCGSRHALAEKIVETLATRGEAS